MFAFESIIGDIGQDISSADCFCCTVLQVVLFFSWLFYFFETHYRRRNLALGTVLIFPPIKFFRLWIGDFCHFCHYFLLILLVLSLHKKTLVFHFRLTHYTFYLKKNFIILWNSFFINVL